MLSSLSFVPSCETYWLLQPSTETFSWELSRGLLQHNCLRWVSEFQKNLHESLHRNPIQNCKQFLIIISVAVFWPSNYTIALSSTMRISPQPPLKDVRCNKRWWPLPYHSSCLDLQNFPRFVNDFSLYLAEYNNTEHYFIYIEMYNQKTKT